MQPVTVSGDAGAPGKPTATAWPFVIAAAGAAAVIVYLWLWGRRYGLDLRVYRNAVDIWKSGGDPYRASFTASRLAFTYPPFALLALSPLTWTSFPVAQWFLWAASVAAAAGSVVLVVRDLGAPVTRRLWLAVFAWACVSVLALEPARSGIDYGQIEFILMFIIVADLLLLPSPYRGVLIGVAAAVKLTPLVFVIVLIVSRDVRSVIRATASFLACTGLLWLYSPGLSRAYWLHDVIHPARIGTITYGGNQSWYAILHRPPFPATGSAAAWLLISLAALAASILVARRCVRAGQRALAIVAVALAGLLISPISWTHHWIWVLLIPPVLVCRRGPDAPRPVRFLLWGIVALTVVAPYWWFGRGIAAYAFDAVLPLWTSAALVVWGAAGGQRAAAADAARPVRYASR